jgi:hypothetical protein
MSDALIVHAGPDAELLLSALRRIGIAPSSLSIHVSNRPDFDRYKALIVVWSAYAIGNDALKACVWKERHKGKLFFVRLDDSAIPVGFIGLHNTVDLRDWDGSASNPAFQALVGGLERKVGRSLGSKARPSAASKPSPKGLGSVASITSRTKIFLCYRRNDTQAITGRICDRLVAAFGKDRVVFDIDSIPYGIDFRDHIRDEMAACHTLIAVIGNEWLGRAASDESCPREPSDFVRHEIQMALEQKLRVIPALVGGARMPNPQDLPKELAAFCYLNAAPIDPGRDFHTHVDGLLRSIPNA